MYLETGKNEYAFAITFIQGAARMLTVDILLGFQLFFPSVYNSFFLVIYLPRIYSAEKRKIPSSLYEENLLICELQLKARKLWQFSQAGCGSFNPEKQ